MKKSALLVALTAASLAGGIAFAQTQPQSTRPATDSKPETTRPVTPETTRPATDVDASFSLTQLDRNKDGAVDKQEARTSAKLAAIFDKADTNKDGKLDAAELSAASSIAKTSTNRICEYAMTVARSLLRATFFAASAFAERKNLHAWRLLVPFRDQNTPRHLADRNVLHLFLPGGVDDRNVVRAAVGDI